MLVKHHFLKYVMKGLLSNVAHRVLAKGCTGSHESLPQSFACLTQQSCVADQSMLDSVLDQLSIKWTSF